ncbi:MAG: restriction endonuclease [Pirellula sp.]
MDHKTSQLQIFNRLKADRRLTGSAKRQLEVFLELLGREDSIGFDNTSALFYGFLCNAEFTATELCPLTKNQIVNAKTICRAQALRDTAKDCVLLERVSHLPLADLFGSSIDLKDLAISFLTYASKEPHFAYVRNETERLHKYLDIPDSYFLNVYNLRHDLNKIGCSLDDLIVNLSRLRAKLWVPDRMVSVVHRRLLDSLIPQLPNSLNGLSESALEDLMMEYFDRAGFVVLRVGRYTTEADGGLDVIAYTRDSDVGELRVAVQCKVTQNRIQPRLLREFNTSLTNARMHKGIFVASSGFTSDATTEVTRFGYPMELMDYVRLTNQLRRLTDKN